MKNIEFKEKISHGTKAFPVAYYPVNYAHPRYNMDIHWHNECEFIRILQGSFELNINSETYHLNEGDIAFINSGFIHSGIPKNCTYECLVFDISYFRKEINFSNTFINSIISFKKEIQTLYSEKDKTSHAILENIFKTMKNQAPGYKLKFYGLFYYFLGIVKELNLFTNNLEFKSKDQKKLLQIKKVILFIQQKYMYDISLKDLADSLDLNMNYFCKFFKEITQTTPVEYLNYYRIECAKEKLKESQLSITEIAYDCGFNDLSHFTKVFKKYTNMTPRNYCKQQNIIK